jgi:hypothetical protein
MNLTIVLDDMTYYKALHGLDIMIVVDVMACYRTLDRVESKITVDADTSTMPLRSGDQHQKHCIC